jgi:hypothetical protein
MNPLGLNTIVAASPGVITPPASAEMAALHRARVADERQLDSLAGQRLGLAREQCRGGDGRLVVAVDLAAGGVAGLALFERPPAHPPRRFGANPLVGGNPLVIDISLGPMSGPFAQSPLGREYLMTI